ncbi:unnamed protein product [Rotaria sordida]|uniref:Uncharacterized protein n=1 Tax=Rotaria sordida TaxID=392033 RepID=A0A815BJ72_9BILA|nr:unnamed protein product [Rotaria sordida]CAF1331121.1 unnamed protein product [Rotaria sordida]
MSLRFVHDDYPLSLTLLFENTDGCTNKNLTTEFNVDDDWKKTLDELFSEAHDVGTTSRTNNIEQLIESSVD